MNISEALTAAYKIEYEAGSGSMAMLINHAVAIAREAEYEAERAQNLAQTGTDPAYPPWVRLLFQAMSDEAVGKP